MSTILAVVIGLLAAVVGYLLSQLRHRSVNPGNSEAQVRVDTEGLVTAVKEAVDAQVSKAAQTALKTNNCLLYTSPSPRDLSTSRMPSSA